jgi:Peptidase family M23
VPIRAFPVALSGRPHYADDFGYVRPGKTHAHQGVDIFADLGAPVVAPDAGIVRLTTDPLGGQVFILSAQDGVRYYGAHLSAYAGSDRPVIAGETIGYVGTTGNAQGTSPHLHFEKHPGGGAAVDPYPELYALDPSGGASGSSGKAPTSSDLGAQAMVAAFRDMHPGAAAGAIPVGLLFALAWAMGVEGSYSAPYEGTNNVGSYHATSSFASTYAAQRGYGMVAFLDHDPDPYISRMRVYPTRKVGARAYLDLVTRDVGDLATFPDDEHAYIERLYATSYFGGFHAPRTPSAQLLAALKAGTLEQTLNAADQANIADGVKGLAASRAMAAGALAAAATLKTDPNASSYGPPFAPLALRLTPGSQNAPHTLEHARELLGARAEAPPLGGIKLSDALNASGGDGVWMFGAAAPATTTSKAKRVVFTLAAAATVAGIVTTAALGAAKGW